MKNRNPFNITIVVIYASILLVQAQIPNGDFEEWDDFNPTSWLTTNIPGYMQNITKSSDAHNGAFALRGDVSELMGTGLSWPPFVVAGDSTGFAVNQNYNLLNGWYKFVPQGADIMFVVIVMYSEENGIGGGDTILPAAAEYQSFSVPITYYSNDPVTKCYIEIFSGDTSQAGTGGTIGSYFIIDDLSFSGITAVEDEQPKVPVVLELKQNYPNPFNPSTTIEFTLAQGSLVSLVIYDIQGREVRRLIDNELLPADWYRVNWTADFPSGVYFYRLTAGDHMQTRRMTLLK